MRKLLPLLAAALLCAACDKTIDEVRAPANPNPPAIVAAAR
jgi:hypothetical protein